MSDDDLSYLSATEAAALIRGGSLSPVDLVTNALARIEEVNPTLNCFCFTYPAEAMERARAAERAIAAGDDVGPLHGVPIAIKDLTPTRGKTTTFGSYAYKDWCRITTRSWSSACARRAPSWWARPRRPSSPSPASPIARSGALPAIRGARTARRAARRVAPPLPWSPAACAGGRLGRRRLGAHSCVSQRLRGAEAELWPDPVRVPADPVRLHVLPRPALAHRGRCRVVPEALPGAGRERPEYAGAGSLGRRAAAERRARPAPRALHRPRLLPDRCGRGGGTPARPRMPSRRQGRRSSPSSWAGARRSTRRGGPTGACSRPRISATIWSAGGTGCTPPSSRRWRWASA